MKKQTKQKTLPQRLKYDNSITLAIMSFIAVQEVIVSSCFVWLMLMHNLVASSKLFHNFTPQTEMHILLSLEWMVECLKCRFPLKL